MANTITIGARTIAIVPDGVTDFDITTIQTDRFPLDSVTGNFTVGETVVQATSGAMGVVARWDKTQLNLYLWSMTGTFDATHALTGASSGAIGTPIEVSYAFPGGIRLTGVAFKGGVGDHLVVRNRAATGEPLFNRVDHHGSGVTESMSGHALRCKPFIAATECSFGDATQASISLEYD